MASPLVVDDPTELHELAKVEATANDTGYAYDVESEDSDDDNFIQTGAENDDLISCYYGNNRVIAKPNSRIRVNQALQYLKVAAKNIREFFALFWVLDEKDTFVYYAGVEMDKSNPKLQVLDTFLRLRSSIASKIIDENFHANGLIQLRISFNPEMSLVQKLQRYFILYNYKDSDYNYNGAHMCTPYCKLKPDEQNKLFKATVQDKDSFLSKLIICLKAAKSKIEINDPDALIDVPATVDGIQLHKRFGSSFEEDYESFTKTCKDLFEPSSTLASDNDATASHEVLEETGHDGAESEEDQAGSGNDSVNFEGLEESSHDKKNQEVYVNRDNGIIVMTRTIMRFTLMVTKLIGKIS